MARVRLRLPDASLRTSIYVTPTWLDRFWAGRALAMTLPWGIYLPAGSLQADPELLFHELVHVQQWARLGVARFGIRYVSEYLLGRLRGQSHTEAYRAISFEREARRLACEIRAGC